MVHILKCVFKKYIKYCIVVYMCVIYEVGMPRKGEEGGRLDRQRYRVVMWVRVIFAVVKAIKGKWYWRTISEREEV